MSCVQANEADPVPGVSEWPASDLNSTDKHRNDAVVPISDSHPGCPTDVNGLCSFDHVVSLLQKRVAEINFDYDCFGNYTAKAGVDYNGRAPRS